MKACQNCNARSKDDAVKCVHCGSSFEEAKKDLRVEQNAAKQTLFGIPAKKLESLRTPGQNPIDESKKTMAGFNVAGLFGDSDEKAAPPQRVKIHDDEDDDPKSVELLSPQKSFGGGLNISSLFDDDEPVTGPPELTAQRAAKFGTTPDAIPTAADTKSAKNPAAESVEPQTLFSFPASEEDSAANPENSRKAPAKIESPSPKTDTPAGGLAKAIVEKAEPKVSLGSLLPKVTPKEKEKSVEVAKPAAEPAIEAKTADVENQFSRNEKSGTSGIIRKSKSNASKRDLKRKSSVAGAYAYGKEEVSSDEAPKINEKKAQTPVQPESKAQPVSKVAKTKPDAQQQQQQPTKVEPLEPPPTSEPEKQPPIKTAPPEEAVAQLPAPSELAPPAEETYSASVNRIQTIFVIGCSVIVLFTMLGFFAKSQTSAIQIASIALSALIALGSLYVLFTSKDNVLKGAVWSISALVLFIIGGVGAVLGTPLALLFLFAGGLLLLSALFPKIASLI